MANEDAVPLEPFEITPLVTEIKHLESILPSFEPGATTPPRYFQASIQKNLEWSRHTLQRLTVSLSKYENEDYYRSQIAFNMNPVRNIISTLTSYDRRIDEMRMMQGEHVSLSDIYRTGEKNLPYGSAWRLLDGADGPQRFTYYDPPT
ncbi:hypothetical protein ABKA04_001317 [Annulohypoxylon sp. FPYF3050]